MYRRNSEYRDKSDVLKYVNDPRNNIKFIRIVFPDILGNMMDISIPSSELIDVFNNGIVFDGRSLDGFLNLSELDLKIYPDPKSFRTLPWIYSAKSMELNWKEGLMLGEIYTLNDEHYSGDSRYILSKLLSNSVNSFNIDSYIVSSEMEFFIFQNNNEVSIQDSGSYFVSDKHSDIRKEIQLILSEIGISSRADFHEFSSSMHEIVLAEKDALEFADSILIFKSIAKKIAKSHGLYLSFMPQPTSNMNGLGMHIYQSLHSKNKNQFYDDKDRLMISPFARKYIAGLQYFGPEISIVTNQWANSYKRLNLSKKTNYYWGRNNSNNLIRIPEVIKGKENSAKIELKYPDPACNIYLALVATFSAGLQGIKDNLEPTDSTDDSVEMTPEFIVKNPPVPQNLNDAISLAKKSKLLKIALGEHIHNKLILNKEAEYKEYIENSGSDDSKITPYELKKYLPLL